MTEDDLRGIAQSVLAGRAAGPTSNISSSGKEAWQSTYDAEYQAAYDEAFRDSALAERERLGAILSSDAAIGRFEAAKTLALQTSLTSEEAIALLSTMPAAEPKAAMLRAKDAVGGLVLAGDDYHAGEIGHFERGKAIVSSIRTHH